MKKTRKVLIDDWLDSLPQDSPKDVASSIKTYFKRKNISLATVAKEIGISPQLLSYYLNGKKYPPVSFAKKISDHYTEFCDYYIYGGIGDVFQPDNDDIRDEELCNLSPNFNPIGSNGPAFEDGLGKVNKNVVGRYYQDLLESLFGNFKALENNQKTIKVLVKENEGYINNIWKIFGLVRDEEPIANTEDGPS